MADIYIDDDTGRYYTWDGSKFVEYVSSNSAQIGSRGSGEYDQGEEEERQKKIAQDEINHPGYDSDDDNRSAAERMKDISRKMDDENTRDNFEMDKIKVNQREREKQRAIARRNAAAFKGNKAGLTKFKADFSKFIKNEVSAVEMDTWSRPNRRYVNSPFIMPGRKEFDNLKIPSIRVYFDVSASWGDDKIADGKAVIESIVKEYVKKKQLTIEVLYFDTEIHNNINDGGGGTSGRPIANDIAKYRPDNVIVMTDSDIGDMHDMVTVKGGVFLLFKGGISTNLQDHMRGKKITRSYEI